MRDAVSSRPTVRTGVEPYVVAREPTFAQRMELESRLLAPRDEAGRLAVVLIYLLKAIEETLPRCLDVRRSLGTGGKFESERERLVGLLVLAGDQCK